MGLLSGSVNPSKILFKEPSATARLPTAHFCKWSSSISGSFNLLRRRALYGESEDNAMYNKNDRTMEVYVEAGAYARLLSDVGTKAAVAMSRILPAKEADKLVCLLNKIDEVKCKADDQLFKDFPQLGHEGTDVFYGTLSQEPRNELDEEVIGTARSRFTELFGDEARGSGDAD